MVYPFRGSVFVDILCDVFATKAHNTEMCYLINEASNVIII